MRKTPVTHVVRSGATAETWVRTRSTNPVVVTKATVRVAKGDKSGRGGQFHGATNLRGTEVR